MPWPALSLIVVARKIGGEAPPDNARARSEAAPEMSSPNAT